MRFTPRSQVWPATADAVCVYVRDAAARSRKIRVAGSGHSSSPLVETPDILMSTRDHRGLIDYDLTTSRATVGAGTVLQDLGQILHGVGLGMQNLGDVDTQTIAGVISTGTHGSGRKLQNISATLIGVRMVTGTGEIVDWSTENEPDLINAARVSMGLLGIFTAVTLQLQPAYRLRRREYSVRTDDCLAHLDELADAHRNFDFYWYPRRDEVKLRTLHPPEDPVPDLPYARCLPEQEGYGHEIIARERQLKFDELEYFVPAEAGPACFREVRRRILEHHRKQVAWRVLYRLIAKDEGFLSPVHGRDSVAISLHQNATLPYQEYFDDLEPILRAHDGRPHWGKKHSLHGTALAALYPRWNDFMTLRRRLDPQGVFLTAPMARLLGEE
ncbi:D-arabinono-1,4-lactone oxidase [Steroidobacter flavus]|uniref:D-arabinono-1,4-lactone oxidase n=1 Tax=Steroidobacter flavus TaxID=1842136 RepID=A0ABV8SKP9_9GAMM